MPVSVPVRPSRSEPGASGQLRSSSEASSVIARRPIEQGRHPSREEWLIIEWPDGAEQPSEYWISNLPTDTAPDGAPALRAYDRKLSWTTASSKASSAWTTTRAAATSAFTITARSSPPRTGS